MDLPSPPLQYARWLPAQTMSYKLRYPTPKATLVGSKYRNTWMKIWAHVCAAFKKRLVPVHVHKYLWLLALEAGPTAPETTHFHRIWHMPNLAKAEGLGRIGRRCQLPQLSVQALRILPRAHVKPQQEWPHASPQICGAAVPLNEL